MLNSLKKSVRRVYRRFSWRQRVLPGLIIIGAQKSGTTSLHNYLKQHPQLVPAYRKEVHFFDGGLDPEVDTYAKGLRWYRSHFPRRDELTEGQIAYESSPLYLFNPNTPQRIAATIPDVKLIAILRDPVERAISQYFLETRAGKETLPIAEALSAEEERLKRPWQSSDYKSLDFMHHSYKARGIYHEQLARYLKVFSKEQMLVISSADFFRDPQTGLADVFRFAGVDPGFEVTNLKASNVAGNRTEVDDAVRNELKEYFRAPNEQLYELLGKRFEW